MLIIANPIVKSIHLSLQISQTIIFLIIKILSIDIHFVTLPMADIDILGEYS